MPGCVCPHPPLLVPEIGRGSRDEVSATVSGMERLAAAVGEPQTAVIISPHTPTFYDVFGVKTAPILHGNFAAFGCPHVGKELPNDVEFAQTLLKAGPAAGLPIEPVSEDDLDHGVLVPLTFLKVRSLVSLSIVGGYAQHRELGELVAEVA